MLGPLFVYPDGVWIIQNAYVYATKVIASFLPCMPSYEVVVNNLFQPLHP